MKNKILEVKRLFNDCLSKISNQAEHENARLQFLGKKSHMSTLMSQLRDVEPQDKREVGQMLNALKLEIETSLSDLKLKLENDEIEKKINNADLIDITLPTTPMTGSLHPRTIIRKEIEDIFIGMGFVVEDGKEIVTEYDCFDAVNIPSNHPARDMQDTFWLTNNQVLKTHTSAFQNHVLRKYPNQAIKAIMPGRCFRNEALDHSHENTFFQLEGMVVDKNVSIANLIYFMKEMLSKVFGHEVDVRLRPGFFPFVEPGFELDATCTFCGGKGCSTCKHSGWIELCPCGMIHPNVLKNGGFDPEVYNGFAFGLGFDRLVMLRYGLKDIRVLNSGNIKLLSQFGIK